MSTPYSSKESPSRIHGGIDANVTNVAAEQWLQTLASELKYRSQHQPLTSGLVFATPPAVDSATPEIPTMDLNDLEFHRLSLIPDEPANEPILEYENWLLVTRNKLLQQIGGETQRHHLPTEFEEEFRILQRHKIAEWRRQQEDLKLRECAKTFANRTARPTTWPSVETGMLLSTLRCVI